MNGYIAFYRGKQIEVRANTLCEAKEQAVAKFKARKSHEVSVHLAEVAGKPVTTEVA